MNKVRLFALKWVRWSTVLITNMNELFSLEVTLPPTLDTRPQKAKTISQNVVILVITINIEIIDDTSNENEIVLW